MHIAWQIAVADFYHLAAAVLLKNGKVDTSKEGVFFFVR
jgi:hypothetical protein